MGENVFIPLDIGVPHDAYGPVFVAKYDSICPKCGFMIEVGDDAVMLNVPRGGSYSGLTVHDRCKDMVHEERVAQPEQGYVVKGRRKMLVCPDCHLEHVGECE
jgi:hypothetical protein